MSEIIVTLVVAAFASSGLWSFVMYMVQRRNTKKDAVTRLILGLAYRQIMESCMEYIKRGSITKDEYEDLIKYLFAPYKELGGDGTAERLVGEVQKLPIKGLEAF